MKTELKVHFYLRKTDEKKNGECPVIGKITIGKDVVQFSAKLTAKASLWDIVSGRVTGKSKHATEINATLDNQCSGKHQLPQITRNKKCYHRKRGKERISRHRIRAGNTNQLLCTPQ